MPADLTERSSSDYADLTRAVRDAGLLRRRVGSYAVRVGLTFAVLVAACTVFVRLGDSWWQLATAVLLALVWTHLAFIAHDAGHKQIFAGRLANEMTGLLQGGLVGLSFGWWVGKHTRHHANPNHEDNDPDIDISVLAFTTRQLGDKQGLLRWTVKHQAVLFLPLLLLEAWSLHAASIGAVWTGRVKRRGLEAVLLAAHVLIYHTAVFLVLSPIKAIAFVAVHQGLWGLYMGLSFAPNHKGMPTTSGEDGWDFLRKQVLTSRNVRGGPWTDFVLGGLNYQIEHHLFPSMPRPHLRRAQPMVQEFCAARNIPYLETGLLESYREVLVHLHDVGAPLRAPAS